VVQNFRKLQSLMKMRPMNWFQGYIGLRIIRKKTYENYIFLFEVGTLVISCLF